VQLTGTPLGGTKHGRHRLLRPIAELSLPADVTKQSSDANSVDRPLTDIAAFRRIQEACHHDHGQATGIYEGWGPCVLVTVQSTEERLERKGSIWCRSGRGGTRSCILDEQLDLL
jgi:hypothetical protein